MAAELPTSSAVGPSSGTDPEPVPAPLLVVGSISTDHLTTPRGVRGHVLGGHGLLAASTIASLTVEDFGVARLVQVDPAEVRRRAATVASVFLARDNHHG